MVVKLKTLEVLEPNEEKDVKKDDFKSQQEIQTSLDPSSEKQVQLIINKLEVLEKLKRGSRERYRKFAKKKRASGYVRKSFWLNLSKEESSLFLAWLKKQSSQSLVDLINLDISLSTLLSSYREHVLKEID